MRQFIVCVLVAIFSLGCNPQASDDSERHFVVFTQSVFLAGEPVDLSLPVTVYKWCKDQTGWLASTSVLTQLFTDDDVAIKLSPNSEKYYDPQETYVYAGTMHGTKMVCEVAFIAHTDDGLNHCATLTMADGRPFFVNGRFAENREIELKIDLADPTIESAFASSKPNFTEENLSLTLPSVIGEMSFCKNTSIVVDTE